MLPCRKHPTNRAEYVNKCKNQDFKARQKPPSFAKCGKEGRPPNDHRTTNHDHRTHETTPNDIRPPPNAPEVPLTPRKPPKFPQTANAHRKFLMCKRAKFPHAQNDTPKFSYIPKSTKTFPTALQTEVFTRPNKPFKFPYPPKSTPKFHKSTKPMFPPMQNDLSKFHHGKKGKRFPHIHNHHPEPTPKIAHSRFLNVQ